MDHDIFFDHTSTTPLAPGVLEAMMPYLGEQYGNPSSHIHKLGRGALSGINEARKHVADLINCLAGEVVFTSGATESNNTVIKGLGLSRLKRGGHILVSRVEHYSVINAVNRLKSYGFDAEMIPVEKDTGLVRLDQLERMLRPDTFLVCLMHSNMEIGTLQPVAEAVKVVKGKNKEIHFHCDATGSAGWVPVDVKALGVDSLTLSAHNFYGPKGVGALYLKEGTQLVPLLDGGFQESNRRAGTENVPGIVGMGEASRLALLEMDERIRHLSALQSRLWKGLEDNVEYIHFTGHPDFRLPGHVSFWVEFAEGESLLLMLTLKKIIAASGSACSSNMLAQDEDELIHSNVLDAIGVPQDICSGSVTMLMGRRNTPEEVDYVVSQFPPILERLWAMSPAYGDMMKQKGAPAG